MAKITLLRNGQEVKTSEVTLESMKTILTTKNPTEGVARAASVLGSGNADAYIEAFAAGNADDTFEILVEGSSEGKSIRSRMVNLLTYAVHPENWQNELPASGEGRQAKDKGVPELL